MATRTPTSWHPRRAAAAWSRPGTGSRRCARPSCPSPHSPAMQRTMVSWPSVGLSQCVSQCVCQYVSQCVCQCVSQCVSVCISMCVSVYVSVSVYQCLSVCVYQCLSVCVYQCLSVCVCGQQIDAGTCRREVEGGGGYSFFVVFF